MNEAQRVARFARQVRASSLKRFDRVDEQSRCWRPAPDVMSFADHLAHLVDCDRWMLKRLRHEPTQPAIGRVGMADENEWGADLTALTALGGEVAALVESLDEDELARTIDAPMELDCPDNGSLVLACLDHEVHHRGMVQLLLRLRGRT